MVALYFALEDAKNTGKPVVWIAEATPAHIALPSGDQDPFSLKRTTFFRPNLVSPRIVAQDGWFSVHKYVATNKTFIPLEGNRYFRRYLSKIIVSGSSFDHLANLDLCGINRASLFPGIDGISKYINWKGILDNWVHIRMPRRRSEIEAESRTSISSGSRRRAR